MEKWRAIVGYEGFYEISDLGNVRSIDRTVACGSQILCLKGKLLSRAINKQNGYYIVTLYRLGKGKSFSVHALVLEAFVGSRPSAAHDACHNDGNRLNSALSNLRWGTKKENRDDSRRHGTLSIGSHRTNAKLNEEMVKAIRKDTRLLEEIALHYGIGVSTACKVKNRISWKHVE